MFDQLVIRLRQSTDAAEPDLAAAALWAGIHGIAVLSATGSLSLTAGDISVDDLVRRVVSGAINARPQV